MKMASDSEALTELGKVSNITVPRMVAHYLYFPSENAGKKAAEQLSEWGFTTEDRLGADDINWLILAKAIEIPSIEYVSRMRQQLESLAASLDGEYDGWEFEVAM